VNGQNFDYKTLTQYNLVQLFSFYKKQKENLVLRLLNYNILYGCSDIYGCFAIYFLTLFLSAYGLRQVQDEAAIVNDICCNKFAKTKLREQ